MMRLTSAATAYAECAWVLWQREVIAKRDIGWAPRKSFKDISECKKKESKDRHEVQRRHAKTGAHTRRPHSLPPRHRRPARAKGK